MVPLPSHRFLALVVLLSSVSSFPSAFQNIHRLPMLATPPRSLTSSRKHTASPTSVSNHPRNSEDMKATPCNATKDECSNNSDKSNPILNNPRSCVLHIGGCAGKLCGLANTHLPFAPSGMDDNKNSIVPTHQAELASCIGELLQALLDAATCFQLDLIRSIHNKMSLNAKKYPVELCKVSLWDIFFCFRLRLIRLIKLMNHVHCFSFLPSMM